MSRQLRKKSILLSLIGKRETRDSFLLPNVWLKTMIRLNDRSMRVRSKSWYHNPIYSFKCNLINRWFYLTLDRIWFGISDFDTIKRLIRLTSIRLTDFVCIDFSVFLDAGRSKIFNKLKNRRKNTNRKPGWDFSTVLVLYLHTCYKLAQSTGM